ncbi:MULTISPECIES: DUF4406 domain-containing protein [unclassified Carboxylicivirga]|uniref:DUF4406 domain-containing protein n=1 Tax=Carboxylicivirga TaxID=1628153 RepID=UPI003D343F72
MRKIYICGNETDSDDGRYYLETDKIKKKLKSMRCSVINPTEIPYIHMGWTDAMESRISQLKKCQAIYVLPNWKENIMARIELTVAMDLKLETIFHPVSNKEIREILTSLNS